ncbi:MAG: 8-amino-7-oxononanoate synthase [Pseudomonadota bacterium]
MSQAPAQSLALDILAQRLDDQRRRGLARALRGVGPATGPWVRVEGRPVLLMASNDYLGLARHPRLAAAAAEAAGRLGSGSAASRLVSGTLDLHQELEKRIAAFKETEAALFFATGYMANLGAVAGLGRKGDYVVSDALNHASLIDACRLSRAELKVYPHADAAQAEALLAQAPAGALKLLVTDGVFSMDGDLAPLPALMDAARRQGALLVVDDAHATGVWGPRGRGSLDHFGLAPGPELVMVGTFSKALGGLGGFVAGAQTVIDSLIHQARSFLYTTAPPPVQAAVAMEALALVDDEAWRRQRLVELGEVFRRRLHGLGFSLLSTAGPIVPLMVGAAQPALILAAGLLRHGVLAPAMRPPTVPEGASRIRFTITAAHTETDLETAAQALLAASQETSA